MFAALILVISGVMLVQFALFFWRANMLAAAAGPISETLASAQASLGQAAQLSDFEALAAMNKLCPDVHATSVRLWPVRMYYQAVRALSMLCSALTSQGSSWTRQEMAFCTRYLVVSLDRRLISNQAYLAALRSF